MANRAQRRQLGEAAAEALHAPALVVHRHEQPRRAHRMDLAHQFLELPRVVVIAGEQDHRADQRVGQHAAVLGRELVAGHVHHQRAKRHGALPVARHAGHGCVASQELK